MDFSNMRFGDAVWNAYFRKKAKRDHKAQQPHYVYLASDKNGRVKIGITWDVEKREKQLKHANPDIEIKNFIEVCNRADAFELEGELHQLAYKLHINGEWYAKEATDIFNKKKEQNNARN